MPNDNSPAPAPAAGDPPASPAVVKKTPGVKTPAQIDLEKKVAKLEDRVGGVEGAIDGINNWLGDLFPGGKPAAPAARPSPGAPQLPTSGGLLDDVEKFLNGED
jgi:hypothetical protein